MQTFLQTNPAESEMGEGTTFTRESQVKKLLLVVTTVLVLAFTITGCSPTQTSTKSDAPRYTTEEVIAKAIARGNVGWNGFGQHNTCRHNPT